MIKIKRVTWHEEDLHNFYGHENDGFIWGLYYIDENKDVIDVEWFQTKKEREDYLKNKKEKQ
jgi:hypothetical protein